MPLERLGSYTFQLAGYEVSEPFTLEADGRYEALVLIYDDEEDSPGEPDPEGEVDIFGNVLYCTSPDISNTSQYLISGGFPPASSSDCVASPENTGLVHIYLYENSGDTEPIATTALAVSFGEFSNDDYPGTFIEVPYFDEVEATANVRIRKDICTDAE